MLAVIFALYFSFSVPTMNDAPRQTMLAPQTEFYNLTNNKKNRK